MVKESDQKSSGVKKSSPRRARTGRADPHEEHPSLSDLRQIILGGVWDKPWGHGLAQGIIPLNRVMSEIGG